MDSHRTAANLEVDLLTSSMEDLVLRNVRNASLVLELLIRTFLIHTHTVYALTDPSMSSAIISQGLVMILFGSYLRRLVLLK